MPPKILSVLFCLCIAIFANTVAHAIGMHNAATTPEQAYLDYADNFPSVGWLGTVDTGVTTFGGSAVLIDEHWVLTAAHALLIFDNIETSFYEGYRVGFTDDFVADPGENLFADDWFIHPDYNDVQNGPDLALLYFEDAYTSVTPATLYTGLAVAGDEHSIVGFGDHGTPATGLQGIDGKRRAGINALTDVGTPAGYMRARFLDPGLPAWNTLGALGVPGDSGGGWFVDVNGQMQLSGISSFWGGGLLYGIRTGATELAPHISWINDTIASKQVPEPSSLLLASLAGCALLHRRRRG